MKIGITIFSIFSELLLGGNEKATKNKVKIVLLKVDEGKLRDRVASRAQQDPKHFASPSLLPSQLEAFEVFF